MENDGHLREPDRIPGVSLFTQFIAGLAENAGYRRHQGVVPDFRFAA